MSINLAIVFFAFVQLLWLVVVWRKSGFFAALSLFAYGALASLVFYLSMVKDGAAAL